jgi:hypothetical protein
VILITDRYIRGLSGLKGCETAQVVADCGGGTYRQNGTELLERGNGRFALCCLDRVCVLMTYFLSGTVTSHAYLLIIEGTTRELVCVRKMLPLQKNETLFKYRFNIMNVPFRAPSA